MPWTDEQSVTDSSVGSTDSATILAEEIRLPSGGLAHIQIEADNNTGAPPQTDDLEIRVYATTTGSPASGDWDTEPLIFITVDTASSTASDPALISFTVSNVYMFRVGVRSTGSTDTHDVTLNYRVDGVEL